MVIALPPAAPSETQEHGSGQRRTRLPSANPMPLSAAQEAQVLEIYHNRVKAKCAAEIKGAWRD